MIKYSIFQLLIASILLLSCNGSKNRNRQLTNTPDSNNSNLSFKKKNTSHFEDSIHFFTNCSELLSNSSIGAFQEPTLNTDSANFICFADCYSCKKQYEVIFLLKGDINNRKQIGYDSLSAEFMKGCDNNFAKFDCFAFVNPSRDPDTQKDPHAINLDFPLITIIYHRITDDNWKLIGKVKVASFKEYQLLQFKIIYGLR
jgi:hypothetical protein